MRPVDAETVDAMQSNAEYSNLIEPRQSSIRSSGSGFAFWLLLQVGCCGGGVGG